MWFLRLLNENNSNQIFLIKSGAQVIGRSQTCDIVLPFSDISKRHAEIVLEANKIRIKDLNSRNGIAVNGHKVKESELKSGDKVLINKTIFELISLSYSSEIPVSSPEKGNPSYSSHDSHFSHKEMDSSFFMDQEMKNNEDHQIETSSQMKDKSLTHLEDHMHKEGKIQKDQEHLEEKKKSLFSSMAGYIDQVFLPGIYKLAEWTSFKGALGVLIIIFIFLFNFFSFFPIIHVFQSNALEESKLRALTIARSLAKMNKEFILNEMESSASISSVEVEKGVQRAMIVSARSGVIITPSFLSGKYPKISFLHEEIKKNKESIRLTKKNQIVALSPINQYDPELNILKPIAHAVVIYNPKTSVIKKEQKISFFIQSFLISLIAGSILFFLIIKLNEHLITQINNQLDLSLKGKGANNLEFKYTYPIMEKLVSNVNSALNRISYESDSEVSLASPIDRSQEMENIIQLIGFPASTVLVPENKFGAINRDFADKLGSDPSDLLQTGIDDIGDQALKLSLLDLLENVRNNPSQMAVNNLELSGLNYDIAAQSVSDSSGIVYVLIVLLPSQGEENVDEQNQFDEVEDHGIESGDIESA